MLVVAHVREGASGGGVGRHLEALIRALRAASHEVFVYTRVSDASHPDLTWFQEGPQHYRWNHLGESGTSFRERSIFAPAEAAFREVMDLVRPDLVSIHHTSWFSLRTLSIAREMSAAVVLTLHDFIADCPRGQRYRPDDVACIEVDRSRCSTCVTPRFIEAARGEQRGRSILKALFPSTDRVLFAERDQLWSGALAMATAIVVPSRSTCDLLAASFPVSMQHAQVLAPFIDVPWDLLEPIAGDGRRVRRIGYFGSVIPSKGIDIAAMAAARSHGEFELHVFGGDRNDFQAAIARRAGSSVVWREAYDVVSLPLLMSGMDAVVIPSRWPETYNLVLRESGLLGRPIVASAIGALNEACDRGWATPVLPGDPELLLRALRNLQFGHLAAARIRSEIAEELADARAETIQLYERLALHGKTVT